MMLKSAGSPDICLSMRGPIAFLFMLMLLGVVPADAASGRVLKVLPHLLDTEGRHTLSPSLFERDAYQQHLRQHPEKRSGVRVDVHWKARGRSFNPLILRVELRGAVRTEAALVRTVETEVRPTGWLGRWTSVPVTGEDYSELGDLTAWRVTLWDGDELLSERTSFLW